MSDKKITRPEWIPSGYSEGNGKTINKINPSDNSITQTRNSVLKNGIYKRKSKQADITHSKLGE